MPDSFVADQTSKANSFVSDDSFQADSSDSFTPDQSLTLDRIIKGAKAPITPFLQYSSQVAKDLIGGHPIKGLTRPIPGLAQASQAIEQVPEKTTELLAKQGYPGLASKATIPLAAAGTVASGIIPENLLQAGTMAAIPEIAGAAGNILRGTKFGQKYLPTLLGIGKEGAKVGTSVESSPAKSDPALDVFLQPKALTSEEKLRTSVTQGRNLPFPDRLTEVSEKVKAPLSLPDVLEEEKKLLASFSQGKEESDINLARSAYARSRENIDILRENINKVGIKNIPPDALREMYDSLMRDIIRKHHISGEIQISNVEHDFMESIAKQLVRPVTESQESELGRAVTAGVVKPIQTDDLKQTVVNLVERQARPKLDSEQAIQGLKQTTGSVEAIANEALSKIKAGTPISVKEGMQITDAIVEGINTGELDPSVAARILGNEKLAETFTKSTPETAAEYASKLRVMSSQFGYGLSQLSRVSKALEANLGPEARKLLDGVGAVPDAAARFNNAYRYLDSIRKTAMVSNLSLAMRDMVTHGTLYTTNMIEDAMNGVLGAITGKIPAKDAFRSSLQDMFSLANVVRGKNNADLGYLMEKFPVEAEKMVRSPLVDMALPQRVMRALNTVHNVSFSAFQKAGIDAFLRNRAALRGVSVRDLGIQDFKEAINFGNELTLSKNFKPGTFFGDILKLYRDHPWMTALGQTFPRVWANIMTTMKNFSPIPLLQPSTYAKMAAEDPKVAFGAINKSLIGTGIASIGWYLGTNGRMEGNWYDVRLPNNRVVDLRRFHPFAGLIFMGSMLGKSNAAYAGALQRGQSKQEALAAGLSPLMKLSGRDWIELSLSLKRTQLSGIPILDAFEATTESTGWKRVKDTLLEFVGQYLSSFEPSILTRTPLDIMGQYNREDRLPRFVRDRPVLGPAIVNVPFLSRQLPLRYSPLRSGVEERDNPGLQQVIGAITRVKTPVELESDRLGLTYRDVYPTDNQNPKYANLAAMYMGPWVEKSLGSLINSKAYLKADDDTKKFLFKTYVNEFRKASKDIVMKDKSPQERIDEAIQKTKGLNRKYLEKAVQEGLGTSDTTAP